MPEKDMLARWIQRALQRYERAVYGGASRAAELAAGLSPSPLPEAWVLGGAPRASASALTRSRDGGFISGVWECTPGRFRWYFACDEVIVVLAGSGRVRVGQEEHVLRPGTSVFFPVGTDSEWQIEATLRKHFTHRFPSALVHRALAALGRR